MPMEKAMSSLNPFHPRTNAASVARALENRTEEVAAALLGEPSAVLRHEHRWGRRGSLSLCRRGPKRGFFYDHERGEGGDLLALVARERGVTLGEAIRIAKREFLGGVNTPRASKGRRRCLPQREVDNSRTEI